MKDLSLLVSNIKQKAEKLAKKHQLLQKENESLSIKMEEVKKELEDKSQLILELNEKIKLLRLAKNVGGESTKEVKLKINEMVREIDKCIAQINR